MSFLTDTIGSVGNAAKNVVDPRRHEQQATESSDQKQSESTSTPSSNTPTPGATQDIPANAKPENSSDGGFISGLGKAGTSFTSATTSGLTSGLNFTSDLVTSTSKAGLSISQTVAQSSLDFSIGVVGGTADLAGTALGGIVTTAAETSGKVFEPVVSGLKAVEGFEKLGETVGDGLNVINGLPIAAVQQVGRWTMQAANMSGKTPTFFDVDGDGTVTVADTIKGLIVLGLDETNSKYAAYALHAVFSYSTGTSWVLTDTNLPITVSNMSRTRWGKNWGQYDRMDWVQDVDINQFFAASDEATWQEKFKKGRQYFGVLLLIFEWGTTWPFIMPDVPIEQIPFKDEIGKVVRTLILPTIFSNFQRARAGKIDAGNEPPAKDAPSDPNDA